MKEQIGIILLCQQLWNQRDHITLSFYAHWGPFLPSFLSLPRLPSVVQYSLPIVQGFLSDPISLITIINLASVLTPASLLFVLINLIWLSSSSWFWIKHLFYWVHFPFLTTPKHTFFLSQFSVLKTLPFSPQGCTLAGLWIALWSHLSPVTMKASPEEKLSLHLTMCPGKPTIPLFLL